MVYKTDDGGLDRLGTAVDADAGVYHRKQFHAAHAGNERNAAKTAVCAHVDAF